MRSCHVVAALIFGAVTLSGPAQASGLYYNTPGAYPVAGSHAYGHHGVVSHAGWRQAPSHRHARRDVRRGIVVGAVAGALVGGLAVAATRERTQVYDHYYGAPQTHGYYAQPAPSYGYQTYTVSQQYRPQPHCFQQREHLFNSHGVYRGVFPVRVCQ